MFWRGAYEDEQRGGEAGTLAWEGTPGERMLRSRCVWWRSRVELQKVAGLLHAGPGTELETCGCGGACAGHAPLERRLGTKAAIVLLWRLGGSGGTGRVRPREPGVWGGRAGVGGRGRGRRCLGRPWAAMVVAGGAGGGGGGDGAWAGRRGDLARQVPRVYWGRGAR